MKVSALILLSFLLLGCGVSTDSSSLHNSSTDSNDSSDTNDSGDTNGDDNTTGGGTTVIVDDASSAGFSKIDAQEDASACIINGTFQAISDSSFDPNAIADSENGLELASQYPYSSDLEATKVVLYYPSLGTSLVGEVIHIYEDNYRLSFDKAWSSAKLPRIYIRTPKDANGLYGCYRYDLDSISASTLTKTKVYR